MIELVTFILRFSVYLIGLYTYVVIAGVILSWLTGFGVVNPYNPFVRSLGQALYAVTEPVLAQIRRVMPTQFGAVDVGPVILLLACFFLQGFITEVAIPNIAKLV